jgi:hypothetical protein
MNRFIGSSPIVTTQRYSRCIDAARTMENTSIDQQRITFRCHASWSRRLFAVTPAGAEGCLLIRCLEMDVLLLLRASPNIALIKSVTLLLNLKVHLPCSTGPYPKPDQSSPYRHILFSYFSKTHFNIIYLIFVL